MRITATLEAGGTKHVKGVGTVVTLKLIARSTKELMNLLHLATGGVIEGELEMVQTGLELDVQDGPSIFEHPAGR